MAKETPHILLLDEPTNHLGKLLSLLLSLFNLISNLNILSNY